MDLSRSVVGGAIEAGPGHPGREVGRVRGSRGKGGDKSRQKRCPQTQCYRSEWATCSVLVSRLRTSCFSLGQTLLLDEVIVG